MKNIWQALFGWPATKKDIQKIMATTVETLAAIKILSDNATAQAAKLTKIGLETDGLNKKIQDLLDAQAQAEVPAVVASAIAALVTQSDALTAAVQTVDDKVPDAVATPQA